MRFWKNNRLDAEFEMEPSRVVELFQQSHWWGVEWTLDRSLRTFMTDMDGPISAIWDDQDGFDGIYRLALAAGWAPK